jgi:hypothetical protein
MAAGMNRLGDRWRKLRAGLSGDFSRLSVEHRGHAPIGKAQRVCFPATVESPPNKDSFDVEAER